jgi:Domain of unknown function (DUF303).
MILQRDEINYIYGADSGASSVTVNFMGSLYSTDTEENNDFYIELPPVKAGGPYSLTIRGSAEITITDILFGDVYLLSGQSNMELPLRRVLDVSAKELENVFEPSIRQYHIPPSYNFKAPEKYMYTASWKKAAGEDLFDFSAAGYFFAKEIKKAYQIPVGLIMTAVGGCAIESWISPDTLNKFGDYENRIAAFKNIDYFHSYIQEQQKQANEWTLQIEEEEPKIDILKEHITWDTCRVPSLVSEYIAGNFQGSVYLCRKVFLEEEQFSGNSYLYMGSIIDSDRIWINGEEIGRTEYRYPPRKYVIREGILRPGINLITVRVVINERNGGTIKEKPYYLHYNGHNINLEGEWYYRIGKRAEKPMPKVLFPPTLPICFYHTIIAPLSKIVLKGVLWYQGERNTEEPEHYAEKFAAMISDWRELFGWEIPIIYVQLPNYREPLNNAEDSGWAELREQQRQSLALYNVAMITTVDIGEKTDLHPQNKKALGIRLARAARSLIYNEDIIYSGPLPQNAVLEGERVRIIYQYLEDSGEEINLNNFEMAGRDHIFYKALAIRKGRCVYLSCTQVEHPEIIRYAWCDNPTDLNFYNKEGFPAAVFRMRI